MYKSHRAADNDTIRHAFTEAISHLNTLDTEQAEQRREAIVYFLLLILHRRSTEEQASLIELVEQLTKL